MVSKEFAAFVKIVDGEVTPVEGRDNDYSVTIPDEGIVLDWQEDNYDEPSIGCSATGTRAGAFLAVKAPVSEWNFNQMVDDHNLLTELRLDDGEDGICSSIQVYGPPAETGPFGIEVEAPDEEYLYEDVLETIDEDNPFNN